MSDLAARVLAELTDRLPVYRRLPAEELNGDIRQIVECTIRAFQGLETPYGSADLATLEQVRASAMKRADEGVPIEAVVQAYHLGAQLCAEATFDSTSPGDLGAVLEFYRCLLTYVGQMSAEVSAGYMLHRETVIGETSSARQDLFSALLEGGEMERAAAEAGLRLPDLYVVLAMSVGPHPDEENSEVDPVIATGRKVRRLRTELERHSSEAVLSRISGTTGIALLPAGPASSPSLSGLHAALQRACGVDLHTGTATVSPADVSSGVRLAAEVRDVVVRIGRPPGIYQLADVLLEYQLTRPSSARHALAALLRPVNGKPEFLLTLKTYLACDLNRRQTASRLQVHPNTVDYRLEKFHEITGLDPGNHHDRVMLEAALAAADFSSD